MDDNAQALKLQSLPKMQQFNELAAKTCRSKIKFDVHGFLKMLLLIPPATMFWIKLLPFPSPVATNTISLSESPGKSSGCNLRGLRD